MGDQSKLIQKIWIPQMSFSLKTETKVGIILTASLKSVVPVRSS